MRIRNIRGEYIRIIEQEQVLELDKSGNIWLMLSVIDVDASHESEITKSHLYNFKTGEQIFIDLSDTLDEPLTNRELEVLRFMKKGLLSKEIAETLKVSINTVNSHRQNILQKLKANNSIEAVTFAQRLGLFNKCRWKSHATLTLLAKQDLAPFGYNMIDPLKSWCWGSILFYPFKISRFS